MKCPNCGEDTPPNLRYCEVCGTPMDLSFSKVSEAMLVEQAEHRARAMELHCRQLALAGVTLLVVAVTFWLSVPSPREIFVAPSYRVQEEWFISRATHGTFPDLLVIEPRRMDIPEGE
ncbi:MAG: zinc ribbon domain-containing protein [Planctomycetes bacterium]|nr:zinc ribbon domain-containing protein [Planctomycetota bacterium]